jgi:hypothetical protein
MLSPGMFALSMEQLKQLRVTLSNNFLQIAEHDHSADSGKVWAMWVMVWVIKLERIAHAQMPENIGRNEACGQCG